MIFIGIDPGKTGAIVALDDDGRIVEAQRCPTSAKDFNDVLMATIVAKLDASHTADAVELLAAIERVGTRPGESLRGAFNFGEGVGIWRGIFAALMIGWRWVTPQAWQQRALSGEKRPKDRNGLKAAIARSAIRRWPGLATDLSVKANWGIADAAWIAEHLRLTHTRRDRD